MRPENNFDDPEITNDTLRELLEAMTGSDFAGFIRAARLTQASGAMLVLSPRLEPVIMAFATRGPTT